MRYFTSDWHLGSTTINKLANRPFASQIDAYIGLIDGCNAVAKQGDIVFHVGDFWMEGFDRHSTTEDKNELPAKYDAYVKQISARFVLLEGNHDGHNCEYDLKSMRVDLSRRYRNVYVSHFPAGHEHYEGPFCNWKSKMKIVLCGHVHDKWLFKYSPQLNVLSVNVGVDVWNYKPVRDAEIVELLDYVIKYNDFSKSLAMTRESFDKWKKLNDRCIIEQRKIHKAQKHAKKGLTKEECERRKYEAMKKKGLIK